MTTFTDPEYLRDQQYRDDSNFQKRVDLHKRFSTNPQQWPEWVLERLDLPPAADVLEIGCGPASLWRDNVDRIAPGWRLTLVDLSPGMIAAARGFLGDRAEYVVADMQELPFDDESFDGVIANHMLYHVPDPWKGLSEAARVLRSGGRFFAALNGREHLKELNEIRTQRFHVDVVVETAGDELAQFFEEIELDRYPCDLEVTEVEPVLAFVASSGYPPVDRAADVVADQIAEYGSYHITRTPACSAAATLTRVW